MKSKKFMKGVILVIGILAILFSSLSVIKMFNLLSNEGLMRLIRSADLITFCAIIQVIILTILIIKMCICMSKFSDNAFSEDPFKKNSVIELKKIYKISLFIAILNLIEFRVIQVPYKIDLATLDKNCHLFSAGFNITSGYSIESVSEKLSNSTFFNCFFGINEIFLTMIVLACFTWILSVCFEKAINMKSDNIKLKEENDLTI